METVLEKLDCAQSAWHRTMLAGLVSIAIILRLAAFQGYATSDPRAYSELANDLARGTLHIPDYAGAPAFAIRLGAYAPTAGLIKVFGLSEMTLAAYPFAVSLAGCLLTYALARVLFSPLAGIFGLGVMAVLPIDVSTASALWVDGIAAFWANVGVALAYFSFNTPKGPRALLLGLMSGIFFGVSWLCKEAVVYLIPFVAILGFILLKQYPLPIRVKRIAAIAIGALVILSAESAFYEKLTADPLFRLHATERNYELSPGGFFEGTSLTALVARLFLYGPVAMLDSLNFVPMLAILAAVWSVVFRKRAFLIPTVWLVSLLLMFNFMTTSLKSYKPLLLFDRYLYALVLPSCILVGGFLAALALTDSNHGLRIERRFWATALAVAFCVTSAFDVRKHITRKPQQVQHEVTALLQASDVIYTDFRTAADLVFLRTGLLLPSNENTIPWENVNEREFRQGAYVLIHKDNTEFLTSAYKYESPGFALRPPSAWKRVGSYGNADLYLVRFN